MRQLSFIPPLVINDTSVLETDSDLIKKITVSSTGIELELNNEYFDEIKGEYQDLQQVLEIVSFNSGTHIHNRVDIDIVPLELLYFSSIDFVEDLGEILKANILLYSDEPKNGYFELFFTNSATSLIQKPDTGRQYGRTHVLMPIANMMASLSLYSDSYEEYIENALSSFRENILKPAKTTIDEIMKRSKDIAVDEMEITSIKIQRADLLTLIKQTTNLVTIINSEATLLKEKDRTHSHLIDSMKAQNKLLSILKDHVKLDIDNVAIKGTIVNPSVVEAKLIADFIAKKIDQLA